MSQKKTVAKFLIIQKNNIFNLFFTKIVGLQAGRVALLFFLQNYQYFFVKSTKKCFWPSEKCQNGPKSGQYGQKKSSREIF